MLALINVLAAGVALVSAEMQPPQVVQPPPRFPQQPTLPTRPVQPIRPVDPSNGLTPIRPQSDLPVSGFSAGQLDCGATVGQASMAVQARLAVQANPANGNRARIDILVDGRSVGETELPIRDGAVDVNRRVPVAGASADHTAVFVLNGAVQSAPQTFSHACVGSTGIRTDAQPGVLTLPNLGFGDMAYMQVAPLPPPFNYQGGDARVSLGNVYLFPNPQIVRDLRATTGRVQLRASSICPTESDAYLSVDVALEVQAIRVSDPVAYAQILAGPFESSTRYVDTRDGPLMADGSTPETGDRLVGTPLPQGHQWIVFKAGLACTRDGVLEVRFDPDNRLRETDETDNRIRIRYSTVAP